MGRIKKLELSVAEKEALEKGEEIETITKLNLKRLNDNPPEGTRYRQMYCFYGDESKIAQGDKRDISVSIEIEQQSLDEYREGTEYNAKESFGMTRVIHKSNPEENKYSYREVEQKIGDDAFWTYYGEGSFYLMVLQGNRSVTVTSHSPQHTSDIAKKVVERLKETTNK